MRNLGTFGSFAVPCDVIVAEFADHLPSGYIAARYLVMVVSPSPKERCLAVV